MIEALRSVPFATLGKYQLVCELGSGGMAHVYLALTEGLGDFSKLVVLKVMREELGKNPEVLKLFLAEARLAACLNHPNVVQTLEVGEDAGHYFIEMEYLEGFPLGTLLGKTARNPLPLAERLEMACQLLDGLGYLHELADLDGSPLRLVHRDISPSNVFVTFEGTVKVLDFGVAKAAGLSEVSMVGSFKGKLGYAAPEQLKGQTDWRSDLFTAGLLLWEMLTYRRLGFDRSQTEIIRGRATGADLELMRARAQGIPPELLEICVKAAALEPEDRYPSAAALRDELREYMRARSLPSSSSQLRQLLIDRFGEHRRVARQDLDRRLKALRNPDHRRTLPATLAATSNMPQAFVRESTSSTPPRPWLSRPRLGLALGGLLLAAGGAVSGSLAFRNETAGEAAALGNLTGSAPPLASSASAKARSPGDAAPPSPSQADDATTSASAEPNEAPLGRVLRSSAARAVGPAGVAPRGNVAAARAGAPALRSAEGQASPAKADGDGLPGLAHARRPTKHSARPIDSSNPYSGE